MKTRTGRTFTFLLHMITAVVDDIANALKDGSNILLGDPFARLVRMVIVAIKGDDVGTDKIIVRTIVAFVFRKDGVTGEGFSCNLLIGQIDLGGVETVCCIACALGCVNGHSFVFLHFECSFR